VAGSGGSAGGGAGGKAGSGGGGTGGVSGNAGKAGTAGTSSANPTELPQAQDLEGGCGCEVPGKAPVPQRSAGLLASLMLGLGAMLRRRRS
jgi:MYXO-CTERM domain-containing protein